MIRPLILVVLVCSCAYEQPDQEPVLSPGFDLRRSSPAPGQSGIPQDPQIDLFFDQAPAAESISTSDIRLFSGLIETLGQTEVDLLRRSISFTPSSTLRANLQYQVYLSEFIRGLNGQRLGRPITFSFITSAQRTTPEDPMQPVLVEDLQEIWTASCASGCHDSAPGRAGVDLSSPDHVVRSLKGVSSRGWDMLRVLPDDHARSYLIRKLLGEGSYTGFRMPPDGPPLPLEQIRRIADWIDSGAK